MSQKKTPTYLDLQTTAANNTTQIGSPPSPTLSTTSFMSSVSWMAEKSTAELIPLLKNAYHAIRDKERDLILAAEIGKSLLDNNILMKQRYEELLQNTRSSTHLITDSSHVAALPTPSSSILTNRRYESDSGIESCLDSCDDYGDEDEDENSKTMRFISSQSTRDAMIEVLESKNKELNTRLETILEEQANMDKNNTKRRQELEQEIQELTKTLEMATNKIQQLEDMKTKQQQLRRLGKEKEKDPHYHQQDDQLQQESQQMMDELIDQIDHLKIENDLAVKSKQELETKLANTLKDLRQLKEQFDHFQFTKDDHENLKAAYERQFKHIDELNTSVEEHRRLLQKLKERGVQIHSNHNTPAPSCIDGCSTNHDHGSTHDLHANPKYRNTLLSELENEWIKQHRGSSSGGMPQTSASTPTRSIRHPPSTSLLPTASTSTKTTTAASPSLLKSSFSSFSLKDLSKFTGDSLSALYQQSEHGMESVLARAAGVDQHALDEAIRFVDRLELGLHLDHHQTNNNNNNNEQNVPDWLLDLKIDEGDEEDINDIFRLGGDNDDDGTIQLRGNHHNDNDLLTLYDPSLPRNGLYPDATALITRPPSDLVVAHPRTFTGRIQKAVRHLFKSVWRWCRFAVILTTAILISVWNGPDQLLLEY